MATGGGIGVREKNAGGGGDRLAELEARLALVEGLVGGAGGEAVSGRAGSQELVQYLLRGLGRGKQDGIEKENQDRGAKRGKKANAGLGLGGFREFEAAYTQMKDAHERQKRLEQLMATSFKLCPMREVDLSHCGMHRLPHSLCRAWRVF